MASIYGSKYNDNNTYGSDGKFHAQINGTNQADISIFGLEGDDIIYGLGGNDIIDAGADNDYVDGGADDDTILGRQGNDTLVGGIGNDALWGEADNDILNGGSGNDAMVGGSGNDTLTGGAGADTFVFHYPWQGIDTITDFAYWDEDKIQVSASGFGIEVGDYSRFSFDSSTGALSFDGTQFASIQLGSGFVPYLDINIV